MNKRFPRILSAAIAIGSASGAGAIPLTFEMTGQVGCALASDTCSTFAAETGLPPPYLSTDPYTVDFTLDTSAMPLASPPPTPDWTGPWLDPKVQTYLIDQPGSGLSITLGNLTLEFDRFYLAIGSWLDPPYSPNRVDAIDVFLPLSNTDISFSFSFLSYDTAYFNDLTLEELAAIPLDGFSGLGHNASANAGEVRFPGHWKVYPGGGELRRVSVPEPAPIPLITLGIAGLILYRRRAAAGRAERAA